MDARAPGRAGSLPPPVTVLVDEPRWLWRGQRWAHLCSDASLEELHGFAGRLGLRRVAFQGDHYDIVAQRRDDALMAGAHAVTSRELVRRLRASGQLRRADRVSFRWQRIAELPGLAPGEVVEALGTEVGHSVPGDRLAGLLEAVSLVAGSYEVPAGRAGGPDPGPDPGPGPSRPARRAVGQPLLTARALVRRGELAVVISGPSGADQAAGPDQVVRLRHLERLDRLVRCAHHTLDDDVVVSELFVSLDPPATP